MKGDNLNVYIIDGNNLIGKSSALSSIQKKDKQLAREKLVYLLDRYFSQKKFTVYLHLDGFPSENLNSATMKIIYSQKLTADDKIKKQIEDSTSRRNITLVSSDLNLAEFAKVCGSKIVSSEGFIKYLQSNNDQDDEESRINKMSKSEFLKLFGADNKENND